MRDIIRAHEPHVICLQEIKCVQRDKELVRAIPLAANKRFTGVKGQKAYKSFHSVSSTATGRVSRRNFGVATYVREDVKVVRSREVEWDKEGRVVVVELEDMAIYNVYALNSSQNPWVGDIRGVLRSTDSSALRPSTTRSPSKWTATGRPGSGSLMSCS